MFSVKPAPLLSVASRVLPHDTLLELMTAGYREQVRLHLLTHHSMKHKPCMSEGGSEVLCGIE